LSGFTHANGMTCDVAPEPVICELAILISAASASGLKDST